MDIMLEVTRKCNLKCEHCVRGEAQNKSVSDQVLYALGKEEIGLLTLTGGEPTLVPDIFRRLKQYRVWPNDIWLCTNGKVFKEKFFREFVDYYNCLQYQDISGFSVSVDCYHPNESKSTLKHYQILAEKLGLDPDKVQPHNRYMDYNKIRVEGRGTNISGIETCDRCCEWKQKEMDDDPLYEGYGERTIYITVDGDVLYGSMWSYKRMSHLSLGNITEHSLSYILESAEKTYRRRYTRITSLDYNDLKWKRKSYGKV